MPEPRADRPHDMPSANAFERLVVRMAIAGRSLGPTGKTPASKTPASKTPASKPHLRLLRGGRSRD